MNILYGWLNVFLFRPPLCDKKKKNLFAKLAIFERDDSIFEITVII